MHYKDKRVEGIKIAYIGGGSKQWAWHLMSDLVSYDDISGDVYLYDIHFENAKNNEPYPLVNRLLILSSALGTAFGIDGDLSTAMLADTHFVGTHCFSLLFVRGKKSHFCLLPFQKYTITN